MSNNLFAEKCWLEKFIDYWFPSKPLWDDPAEVDYYGDKVIQEFIDDGTIREETGREFIEAYSYGTPTTVIERRSEGKRKKQARELVQKVDYSFPFCDLLRTDYSRMLDYYLERKIDRLNNYGGTPYTADKLLHEKDLRMPGDAYMVQTVKGLLYQLANEVNVKPYTTAYMFPKTGQQYVATESCVSTGGMIPVKTQLQCMPEKRGYLLSFEIRIK